MSYTGDDRILYIKYLGSYVPVGCLSSNGFSESSDFIDTTTRETNGWKTSRPVSQSYSIPFSGYQKNTVQLGAEVGLLSYDRLKRMKRARTLIEWQIKSPDLKLVDSGKGYISDISESAPTGDWLTFDGSIVGFGVPVIEDLPTNVIYYGASATVPTTLAGLAALTTVAFTSPVNFETGTTFTNFIIGIQTGATLVSVTDLDVVVGGDITSLYTLRSTVSGYKICAYTTAVPYSISHTHEFNLA